MSEAVAITKAIVAEQEAEPRNLFDWLRQPLDQEADVPPIPEATFQRMQALAFTATEPLETVLHDLREVIASIPERDALCMSIYFAGYTDEQIETMAPGVRNNIWSSWERLELGMVARMFLRGTLGDGHYSSDDLQTQRGWVAAAGEERGRRGAVGLIRQAQLYATLDDTPEDEPEEEKRPEVKRAQPQKADVKRAPANNVVALRQPPTRRAGSLGLQGAGVRRLSVNDVNRVTQLRPTAPDSEVHWALRAACRSEASEAPDPDMFYAEPIRAKNFCVRRCPVIAECLADALATNEPYGVRGGKTEEERRQLKRRKK